MYADSSFLVSLYMVDANTPVAIQLASSLPVPFVYSALHRLEIRNAFSLAVFRGEQTSLQAAASWSHLQADVRARLLKPMAMNWRAVLRKAAQIASSASPVLGTRSLDILHVASAGKLGGSEFFSFDKRQRALASSLGMVVRP